MENKTIRSKARKLLKNLPNKYALFAVPIVYHIYNNISFATSSYNNILHYSKGLNPAEYNSLADLRQFLFSLLLTVVTVGISWTLLRLYRQQQPTVHFKDSLQAFSTDSLGRVIALTILKAIFLFLWSLIALLPFLLFIGVFDLILYRFLQAGNVLATILTTIVTIACLSIPAIVKSFSYALTDYLLLDDRDQPLKATAGELITQSRQLMDGYKKQLFLLECSFIGWWLLVFVTGGLASIYVVPYVMTARTIFYEQRRQENQLMRTM